MPRQPRLDIPGLVHHVMARGIEGREIFRDDRDRETFVERLGEVVTAAGMTVAELARLTGRTHGAVHRAVDKAREERERGDQGSRETGIPSGKERHRGRADRQAAGGDREVLPPGDDTGGGEVGQGWG